MAVDKKTSEAEYSDIQVHGDPYKWVCVCKASSAKHGWMKSTKVMEVNGGCLVQVTTERWEPGPRRYRENQAIAEALTFVSNTRLADFLDDGR